MRRLLLLPLAAFLLIGIGQAEQASAAERVRIQSNRYRPRPVYPWHGSYYHSAWGTPVALVVPPNAELQTSWGWGVGATQVTPISAQFGRDYPGMPYYSNQTFNPTPLWPSHTSQFGVYYVRGPW